MRFGVLQYCAVVGSTPGSGEGLLGSGDGHCVDDDFGDLQMTGNCLCLPVLYKPLSMICKLSS